ncbi:MAG: hypothetical protein IIC02_12290, partial [Planctomycetes bacterium]|nr:hypothetical protein [Planctomycetota bacterium]
KYEYLAIGMLNLANDRRVEDGRLPLLTEESFYGTTRGHIVCARALLIKDPDDVDDEGKAATLVDVTPWDSRMVVFERSGNAIIWAANITRRSRATIRSQYPDFKFDDTSDTTSDGATQERVIDYYFTENRKRSKNRGKHMNLVIIKGHFAKEPHDTHAVIFPIIIRAVGRNPGVNNFSFKQDDGTVNISGIAGVGDSVWGAMRHSTESRNRIMSYRTAIIARQVQGVFVTKSPQGDLDIEGRVDEPGMVHAIETDESIEILKLQELGKDAAVYDAVVGSEEQGADLPAFFYGNQKVPFSGAVARMLAQTIRTKIDPYLKPIESLFLGIIEALTKQYETDLYKTIDVQGRSRKNQTFNRPIKPKDIKDHGRLTYELLPELPRDRFEAVSMAIQVVKRDDKTGESLMSYAGARDLYLELQSGDLEEDRNFDAIAKTSTPMMALLTQRDAALERGHEGYAAFLQDEMETLEFERQMQKLAAQFAFMQLVTQDPLKGAAEGVQGQPQGLVGPNGQPIQSDSIAMKGVDPRAFGQMGGPGINPTPSPVAGQSSNGFFDPASIGVEANT